MLPLAASWTWIGGDLIVAIAVIGLTIFGWRQGLFVATVVGLQVLVAFVAALAIGSFAVDLLHGLEANLPGRALAIAALVAFVACLAGIRLAIGGFIPDMAVPFPWLIDRGLGACVGLVAGYLAAGAILVLWSLATLPGSLRFNPEGLRVDPGMWVLDTFARCVELDSARRQELFAGNVGRSPWPDTPRCSEPFIDTNANGSRDSGEPFLDIDGNGGFTAVLGFRDTRNDRRRRLGLAECYRLGAWEGITVSHAPLITSEDRVRLGTSPKADDQLYQATAQDVDGSAGLVFSLRLPGDDDRPAVGDSLPAGPDLGIDPTTGAVTCVADPAESQRRARFTVVVTDPSGLTDEREVLVTW